MAQVTMTLRKAMELENFKLFNFEYKFDDLNMKKKIEESITNYYYFYELGSESPDQFLFRFKTRFLRIIDQYNQLYNTTLIKYDPLTNYKQKENTTQKNASNTVSSTEGSNKSNGTSKADIENNNKTSDYPQQPIAGGDYLNNQNIGTSLSNTTNSDTTLTDLESETTNSSTNEFEKIVEAMTGTTYQDLIQKERDNIINIINMIIEEMKPCFLLVY